MKNLISRMFKTMSSLIEDTLKHNGKWSKSNLTMFSAWMISIEMAFYNMYTAGFNFQVFVIIVSVALGAKVTDAWSKKINS